MKKGRKIDREGDDPCWTRIEAYVRASANAMGMQAWEVRVLRDEPNRGAYATVHTNRNCLSADISFDDEFFSILDPVSQRKIIVHELLHVLQKPVDVVCESAFRFAPPAYADWLDVSLENFIDWVAGLVAPTLLLPDLE
jgi:hypothetical protein